MNVLCGTEALPMGEPLRVFCISGRSPWERASVEPARRRNRRREGLPDGAQGSLSVLHGQHLMEAYGLQYGVSLADGLGEEAERYAELIRLAEQVLGRMQGTKYREMLTRRYILHESWAEISREMGYTDEKSVFRAHGWALVRAQKVLDEMENGELLPPMKCGIV